ncbi:MAG TPA: hypothetical protein VJJ23_05250 [Candidatus Nanoarchaeia archaeon]|nr:hypothetical protein [Candidatus Nanoarchaeia archaeon]
MSTQKSQNLKEICEDEDFKNTFTKYWDNVITGIIAGFLVYYGTKINNGFVSALVIFIFAIILTFIYSLFVWLDKKHKIDNKFWNFFKKYKIHITLIVVGSLLYTKIHELIHSLVATKLGHINSINWNSLIPMVHLNLENMPLNHYFLIAMAPYLVSIVLLLILFILYLFIKRKIIFYLALIPFLDTFANIIAIPLALITNKSNDFLNLFKLSNYYDTILIAIIPIIIFLIINHFRRKNANTK